MISKHVVYIGGCVNGPSTAAAVGEAIEQVLDRPTEAFTFSSAMKDPDTIRRAVHSADVFTHSAGILAVKGTKPERIHSFAGPLPTTVRGLLGNTVQKTVQMLRVGEHELGEIMKFNVGSVREFVAHPLANLKHLRAISQFDTVAASIAAQESGIPARLVYGADDVYFPFTHEHANRAANANVPVLVMPGIHDELTLRPAETLQHYVDWRRS